MVVSAEQEQEQQPSKPLASNADEQQERAQVLECVAITLQCLSLNIGTRRRTIQEGAIRIVLNMLEQQAAACSPRTLQACAHALHAFSAFDDCAAPLLKHQAVPALVKLSGAAEGLLTARESCVAAFCNLLSVEENHAAVLDQVTKRWCCERLGAMQSFSITHHNKHAWPPQKQHGCLGCILKLLAADSDELMQQEQPPPTTITSSSSEALLEYFSCLYSNLACGKPRRAAAVMAGLVPRLVYLCSAPGASVK